MSGEALRLLSIAGDDKGVMSVLRNRSNPCSSDEYGLTALMYAVWNGHLECVKWLLANDRGVDFNGTRRSSIDMVSMKGYTAMHLHCMDSLPWASEILLWLLAAGCDVNMKCCEGLTPEEHASKEGNAKSLEILEKYKYLLTYTGEPVNEDLEAFRRGLEEKRSALARKYAFHADASVVVVPWGANFPVPVIFLTFLLLLLQKMLFSYLNVCIHNRLGLHL